MQLEDLAVNLRPRTPWEASDLGALMYRQWWLPIMRAWLAIYAPCALLLLVICYRQPWLAVLILWWLKPLFDRFVLHVLSRAVFGAIPSVATTLGAWRDILGAGVWADLTYRRFSLRRSFHLPIAQLEGPSSKTVNERAAVLGRRVGAYAAGITLACMNFEFIALIAVEGLVEFFTPQDPFGPSFDLSAWIRGAESRPLFEPLDVVYYATAVTLIEPLYVAQGFGLYLVRRTLLEGWDIEIGFRRIANRLARFGAPLVLLVALGIVGPWSIGSVQAQPAAGSPDSTLHQARQEIGEVMRAPEFERYREVTQWHWKSADKERKKVDRNPWIIAFGDALAEAARIAAWIIAIAAAGALIWYARRHLLDAQIRPAESQYNAPPALFGLDVRPESLPADIPAAARHHISIGEFREALSLLYRGGLSVLMHQHGVTLGAGDTETDAVRRARAVLPAQAQVFFATLVTHWQAIAYANRPPSRDAIDRLVYGWEEHLSRPVGAGVDAPPAALAEAPA